VNTFHTPRVSAEEFTTWLSWDLLSFQLSDPKD
jgi:hypothetical protein